VSTLNCASLETDVHSQLGEMFDALTLLRCAEDLLASDIAPAESCSGSVMLSPCSRLSALLIMSREKLAGAITVLSPHV